MKVRITEDGCLKVIPETGVEKYALSKWNDNYFRGDKKSCLQVCITEPLVEKP